MAAKSIVEIDVQDEKFQSFLEKFNEYQKALSELPEQWRGAVHGLGEAAKETERVREGTEGITKAFADGVAALASVNDGLDRLNGNLEKATKTQTEFNKKSGGARNFLNKASKDAKLLAGHIKDATTSLLSWGTVLGLFSGLAGAGGLWGLNHLAGNASAQRFTAMGLGTTAGGLNSTAVDFQKALGNPVGTLGAIRDAQLDLSKRWQFRAMGVDNPDRDPAELLPEMIKAARDIFVRNGSTQQGAEAYGLTNYFTLDDLNRFKKMSDEEIDAMAKQAQQDTRRLQLTDQQLRQWQDFNIQLDRSKVSIGNTFIRGLAPLAPELGKLSDAFSGAIETVLKSPELGKWIDGLSDGIRRFGNYLASPEFQKDVEAFISGVERLGRVIGKVIDWISGKSDITADDIKSRSSILSDEKRTDPVTSETYTPGGDDDPRVWSWLKGVKKFFASGDVKPVDGKQADVHAKGRTIADRFNNPANLRYAAGYETANTRSGKFAVFPSLDEGVLAAAKQLQIYGTKGINNIHDIISKWAPSNENNTKAYIGHVVNATGRSEFEKLNLNDTRTLAKLITAMSVKEGAGSRLSEGKVIQIINNAGGHFQESQKKSLQDINPSDSVRGQYLAQYGSELPGTSTSNPVVQPVQQGSGKTDQILQQILDNQKRGHAQGLVVYNNTGGNAVVSSTQLGGFG
ncbi:hypothetical protein DT183_00405 [Salmonella enterica subsp. enterica serovar London]|uniref:Bacteriophage protein n=1 Tax=Salmonella enterica subsp. enterica serovar London TaxID=149390 RepID=A0A731V5Z4_SALET|nr:hypothetical protein [Salmonella enterica]EBW1394424.1 hypothetical protein [Salmonella enterica subsp. enterica serovar Newport]EBX9325515.1 hypothetical protein [Salmonella enterica subsp. enterica serovar London]ECI8164588.1 hypothetical protein [Salmonella enterica subsp. enterica serovar Richmond]EEO2923674.1 hypothetical protein [Salmonella enterica subsp. enterica serovar Hvittingfoss]EHC7432176.1 hypothetical protein [Salmonella enterica subsp. enterica serovar Bareilly]